MVEFELVTVGGHRSLRSVAHGETFHPGIGPMEEARVLHVEQQRLASRVRSHPGERPFVIWDVGLGAAANALAVVEALDAVNAGPDRAAEIHSFDLTCAVVEFAVDHAEELGYPAPWLPMLSELTSARTAKHKQLTWYLHLGDFRNGMGDLSISGPDAVLFDPYSPSANPEMWTLEVFRGIRERASSKSMLTCYSRSTAVRTSLLMAGWCAGRGAATGEKEETTVAATMKEMLISPLDVGWLERVSRSTAPGPLGGRHGLLSGQEVAAELRGHPQFAGV